MVIYPYIKCWTFLIMRILGSILIGLILTLSPILMGTNVFSQQVSLDTWQLDSPLLQKTSKNGDILIQLTSSPSNDVHNFPIAIVFLNASLPELTPKTGPLESNKTGDILTSPGLSVPKTLERVIPIQSYDITVYDDKGSELWKKTGQYATQGRGYQNIDFGSYNGKLTIVVDKIIKSNMTTGNILEENQSSTIDNIKSPNTVQPSEIDSVNFTSSISKGPES